MGKPKNTATRTFVCHGRLHRSTGAHELLEKRRTEAGMLFDTTIDELAKNHAGNTLNGNQAQLLTTVVANNLGLQRGPLNARCRIAIGQKAVTAWNNHVNHEFGLPKKYEAEPVRTIETFANSKKYEEPLVTINENGNAKLHFPGLPPIRLYCCRQLPDDQPTYASVSVDGRRVQVSLVYRVPQKPLLPEGQWDHYNVLGIDRGITEIIATSAGASYEGIAQEELDEKIKQAKRTKQAMVRKAVRAGLAGFWALLDENNHQVLTAKGTPRRYLKWFKGKPTTEYRRAAKCLSSLLKQRARQKKAYRHQVSAHVVNYCVENGIQLIALEKLELPNMTKSAKGTVENPARNVAQKRILNRRILDQGWSEVAGYIRYKARREGIRIVEVNPGGTSKTCSTCGHKDKISRKGKRFECVSCDYKADADINAALNIGDRGTYIYMKRKGTSLDDIRQHRINRGDGRTPERQEPGTGIDDAPPAHLTGLTGFHPAPHSNSSLLTATTL